MGFYRNLATLGAVLSGLFLAAPFVSASVVNSQLLNTTFFDINVYPSPYGSLVQSVGNVATGTSVSSLKLWFQDTGVASNNLVLRLYEYESEIDFRNDPYVAPVRFWSFTTTGVTTDQWGFADYDMGTKTLNGFPYFYAIYLQDNTSSLSYINGTDIFTGNTLFGGFGSSIATTTNSIYYQLYSGADPSSYFTPDPSYVGFATSSVATLCDNSYASTSSGWIDTLGASFAGAMCRVGVFLFVPNSSVVSGFSSNYTDLVSNNFPFSWIGDMRDILENYTATSSVEAFPKVILPLGSATSIIGVEDLEVLSTTTVSQFMSDSVRENLKTVMSVFTYLVLVGYIYNDLQRMFHVK